MSALPLISVPPSGTRKLRWDEIYSEADLYKAAVRLYTKPLFSWRKALSTSTDQRTLYDFARKGLQNLDSLHRALRQKSFSFRPGISRHFNFNGRHRTIFLYPWEERLVDLLLYRLVSRRLHPVFSPHSYAYRLRGFGLDRCQTRIAFALAELGEPLYVLKRDIQDYFPSVNHAILLRQLADLVAPEDYMFALLENRIRFSYFDGERLLTAERGIPFGTAIACLFANLYLTPLDRCIDQFRHIRYFRYADDLLLVSAQRDTTIAAALEIETALAALSLCSKPTHEFDILFTRRALRDDQFQTVSSFRHLGLEFRADGMVALSRDKLRKICNLFRFAFRRHRAKFARIKVPEKRALLAVSLAQKTIQQGIRNVAILDYYLKHVRDEAQLRRLDLWLAEEVLFLTCGKGHKKSHFRAFPFSRLRAMGLPSLVHRRRLIQHRRIPAPFFIWKSYQVSKSSRGTAARPQPAPAVPGRSSDNTGRAAFSPFPEAAVGKTS